MSDRFKSQKRSQHSGGVGNRPAPLRGLTLRRSTHTAAALLLAVGLLPSAYSAGLGRLTVQSALGQPLQAEVEVTALSRDEAESLSVRMAPPAAFRQAGLEYNPVLRNLRFAVQRRADGTPFIQVSSSQPLNEPFVDMMVEINWATGRFVREYTFLLDPPELRVQRSTPAPAAIVSPSTSASESAPAAVSAPPATATEAPAPAAAVAAAAGAPAAGASAETRSGSPATTTSASSLPVAASAASAASAPARTAPAATAQASEASSTAAPSAASPGASAAQGRSIEVERGDSLSAIAGRVRPEGASLQQTMLAIYRANPDAFFGSMNNLKAGVSLSVPGQAAIESVDPGEAQRAFRVAIQEYRAYRERLAAAVPTVRASESGRTAEGRIGERAAAPAAAAATQDRLELSRPSTAATVAGTGTGASGAAAAADTEEARVARSAALSEATSRVSELERNVANLQRLLELKDQQLAQVQQRLEAAESAARTATGAIAPAPAARTAPAATPAVPSAQAPATRAPSVPASATSGPRVGETQAPAPSASVPLQPSVPPVATPQTQAPQPQQLASQQQAQQAPAQQPAAQQPATQQAATPPAAAVAPATPATPAARRSEPSFMESLLDNPILLPALGGLAILGAGYAWYAVRRRRREENFEDSLIATDAFSANSLFGSTGGQNVDTAVSGLTTHTSETSMTVASTEVDPIAEAEVYIAYGREAQAEEILREALRKQPERHAVRLKLMEIYSGRKDVEAFNALAREMAEQGGASSDEWPKVVSLGRALDPANPLYGDSAGGARADARPTGGESSGAASGSGAAGLAAGAAMAAAQFVAGDQARAKPDASEDSRARDDGTRDDQAQGRGGREDARLEWAATDAEPAAVQDFDDTAPLGMSAGDGDDAGEGDERLGALDFDLDLDTTVDKAAERLSRKSDDELPTIDDAALDSLSMFEPEIDDEPQGGTAAAAGARRTAASEESADQAVMLDESEPLDFRVDLPSLDDLDTGKARRAVASAQAEKPELDLSAISLDLSAREAEPDVRGADETNPRWQEMATKLDLASAYEEIGDKEGARELLDEVVRSGDAAQQKRARELLERIT